MTSEAERWHLGGRYYGLTVASTPDSFDLELEEMGPEGERETIAVASMPDGGDAISLRVFSDESMPLEVMERFTAAARRRL